MQSLKPNCESSIQNFKLNRDGKPWRCKYEKISELGVQIASGVATGGSGEGQLALTVVTIWG